MSQPISTAEKCTSSTAAATSTGKRRHRTFDMDVTDKLNNNEHITLRQQSQAKKQLQCSSYSEAKANFMSAVSQAVSMLMLKCGYSHERATAALLRELSCGEAPPTSEEVFETMHRCGLGLDQAAKVLTVSRALKKLTDQRGVSLPAAIDDLTSKLSLTNLVRGDERFEEFSADPTSKSAVSIQPVASLAFSSRTAKPQQQQQLLQQMQPTRKHKPVGNKTSKTKIKASQPPTPASLSKTTSLGRKRVIDEISSSQTEKMESSSATNFNSSAKIAVGKSKLSVEDESLNVASVDGTPLRAVAAAVRSKRSRVDNDSDVCQTQTAPNDMRYLHD